MKLIVVQADQVRDLLRNLKTALEAQDKRTIVEQCEIADSIDWTGFTAERQQFETLMTAFYSNI